MKKKTVTWLLLVVLVIVVSAFAQEETFCETDEDCLFSLGEGSYCDPNTNLCIPPLDLPPEEIPIGPETTISLSEGPLPSADTSAITSLQLQIDALQTSIDELSAGVNSLESDAGNRLANLESKLQSLSEKLDALKSKDMPKFNTGLAALQKDVNETSEELSSVQEELDRKGFILYTFLVLVLLGVLAGVVYYLWYYTGGQSQVTTSYNSYAYITKSIKQGKKFPQIKKELLNAGWSDAEIEQAYKETIKQNYQHFLQKSQQGVTAKTAPQEQKKPHQLSQHPKSSSPASSNQVKAIAIALVSLVLIGGGILFLGDNVGQAIHFEKLVGGSTNKTSGEVTYSVECTPPHILNPERNSCCLDANNNTLCDNLEKTSNVTSLAAGKKCHDHQQCGTNKCINNICTPPTYYSTPLDSCSKVCNYYSLDVLTSDGETYTIRPGEGSYTAAGALDWTVMKTPNHCIEESVIVPIEIGRKKTGGKIINTEIITLSKGGTSATLKHAFVPKLAFTLTLDKVNELCAPGEAELKTLIIKHGVAEAKLKAKG